MKPLITIWYKPSETFDYILEKKQNNSILLIYYLIGIIVAIPSALNSAFTKIMSPFAMIFFILGVGIISGILIQYFWSFIFWLSGKILQGKATNREIRIVLAYSLIPFVFKIIVLIPQLINYGQGIIASENVGIYNYLTDFLLFVLFLRFFVIGMSKIQKFSYGYALLNFFIPVLIIGFFWYRMKY